MEKSVDMASRFGSFMATLSPWVREKVLAQAQTFRYLEGETIFREGDPSLYLYLVRTGHVAIEIHVPSRGRVTVLTVGPGDLFSWSALGEV